MMNKLCVRVVWVGSVGGRGEVPPGWVCVVAGERLFSATPGREACGELGWWQVELASGGGGHCTALGIPTARGRPRAAGCLPLSVFLAIVTPGFGTLGFRGVGWWLYLECDGAVLLL